MLTPAQISQATGKTATGSGVASGQPMTPEQAKNWVSGGSTESSLGFISDTVKNIGTQFSEGVDKVKSSVTEDPFNLKQGSTLDKLRGAGEAGLGAAAGVVQAASAPITGPIQTFLEHMDSVNRAHDAKNSRVSSADTPQAQAARQQIADWAKAHPELSKTLMDALAVGTAAIGIPEIKGAAATIKDTAKAGIETATENAKNIKTSVMGATKTPEEIAASTIANDTKASIDAVNPDLTGKNLQNAYKQTVTGKRSVTPSSMFEEQGLSPDERTINLGTRLSDLKLTKNPVKNLDTLGNELDSTEVKLDEALQGDKEINYNADKHTLFEKLNEIKTDTPEEFRVKDSTAMINRVTTFANKIISKTEDSIKGIRDARTSFDAQAKREFPNAFKPDGSIDTKTPSGYAIKTVRDAINEHLYSTAPNGSEIRKLIAREADIFKATEVIAKKASLGEGKTTLSQLAKDNPGIARLIKYGLTALIGGEILKTTGI